MQTIMRCAKTVKAWEALARPDLVGKPVHSLLLMVNGRRSDRELSLLLGDDVTGLMHSLLRQGYLQQTMLPVNGDPDESASTSA